MTVAKFTDFVVSCFDQALPSAIESSPEIRLPDDFIYFIWNAHQEEFKTAKTTVQVGIIRETPGFAQVYRVGDL